MLFVVIPIVLAWTRKSSIPEHVSSMFVVHRSTLEHDPSMELAQFRTALDASVASRHARTTSRSVTRHPIMNPIAVSANALSAAAAALGGTKSAILLTYASTPSMRVCCGAKRDADARAITTRARARATTAARDPSTRRATRESTSVSTPRAQTRGHDARRARETRATADGATNSDPRVVVIGFSRARPRRSARESVRVRGAKMCPHQLSRALERALETERERRATRSVCYN
jgi:hypothetical protein